MTCQCCADSTVPPLPFQQHIQALRTQMTCHREGFHALRTNDFLLLLAMKDYNYCTRIQYFTIKFPFQIWNFYFGLGTSILSYSFQTSSYKGFAVSAPRRLCVSFNKQIDIVLIYIDIWYILIADISYPKTSNWSITVTYSCISPYATKWNTLIPEMENGKIWNDFWPHGWLFSGSPHKTGMQETIPPVHTQYIILQLAPLQLLVLTYIYVFNP